MSLPITLEHVEEHLIRVQVGPLTFWFSFAELVGFQHLHAPYPTVRLVELNARKCHLNMIDGGDPEARSRRLQRHLFDFTVSNFLAQYHRKPMDPTPLMPIEPMADHPPHAMPNPVKGCTLSLHPVQRGH